MVLCTHLFAGGHRCASPVLRGEAFCYYHHPTRRPATTGGPTFNQRRDAERRARRTYSIPRPASREELQQAFIVIVQALAANRVTPRRAGRLLDALQKLNRQFGAEPQEAST